MTLSANARLYIRNIKRLPALHRTEFSLRSLRYECSLTPSLLRPRASHATRSISTTVTIRDNNVEHGRITVSKECIRSFSDSHLGGQDSHFAADAESKSDATSVEDSTKSSETSTQTVRPVVLPEQAISLRDIPIDYQHEESWQISHDMKLFPVFLLIVSRRLSELDLKSKWLEGKNRLATSASFPISETESVTGFAIDGVCKHMLSSSAF